MIPDGTQERTLDPPDVGVWLTEREERELDAAAGDGFDRQDKRATHWLTDLVDDDPSEALTIVRACIALERSSLNDAAREDIERAISRLRDRYIAEMSGDYYGDAIDAAEYRMETER